MDDFDLGLLVGRRCTVCIDRLVWSVSQLSLWLCLLSQDDTDYKVTVLRQKMLGMFPVFMYRAKEKQPGQEYL